MRALSAARIHSAVWSLVCPFARLPVRPLARSLVGGGRSFPEPLKASTGLSEPNRQADTTTTITSLVHIQHSLFGPQAMTLKPAPSPQTVKLEAPSSAQITPINSDNEDEDFELLLATSTPESNPASPAATPSPEPSGRPDTHHTPTSTSSFTLHQHLHHHHHLHRQHLQSAPGQPSPEPTQLHHLQPQHHHHHPRSLVKFEKVTDAQLDRLNCLIKIIRSGNFNEFSEMLQEKTFNNLLNVFVDGQTALHYSLLHGRSLAWCKQLVLNGANPNLTNRAGWHPIHLAAFNGSLETMRYLIDYITTN